MSVLADKHPQHDLRRATLAGYDVLDTAAEADFDDIVALASAICDVPVSLISLVDDDRQWFKARIGFDPEQTTLDQSVCSHAILEDDFIEIPNMALDPRTVDNPLHTAEDGVQFYAGANLVAPNGVPIGTLCILDHKPRELSDFQKQALRTMSRQVMMQLELRKKLALEEALKEEMDHRVKNSLQTIASVLRVAARNIDDAAALSVLDTVERRISAVGTLHSELMGSKGRNTVDTKPYLDRVVQLLADVAPDHVAINVTAEDVALDARKASALGMIVSEFVANSIKHAFPNGQQGVVNVMMTANGKNGVLTCRDNGVGAASEASTESTGIGARLMSAAALQLNGKLEYDEHMDGTQLVVNFGV